MRDTRSSVVERIRKQLFGPFAGENEAVEGKPFWRYMSGILFPSDISTEALGESDEPDATGVDDDGDAGDPTIGLSYKELPRSMGVSFFLVGGSSLICEVEGGAYERSEKSRPWIRRSLATQRSPSIAEFRCPDSSTRAQMNSAVLEGRAYVSVLFRPREGGHLVTATLVNSQRTSGEGASQQIAGMLFQCRMKIRVETGVIGEYPTVTRYSKHEEDEELALAYRHRKTYGIGHGCSAQWDDSVAKIGVRELVAEPLPMVEVKGLTTEIEMPAAARSALSLRWLADPGVPTTQLREGLVAFVHAYEAWTSRQLDLAAALSEDLRAPADRITLRQSRAVKRMKEGVDVLTLGAHPDVTTAFRIAQEAMLTQFLWSGRQTVPQAYGEGIVQPVDPWDGDAPSPVWRPFQFAFQLLALASIADPDSDDRRTLDLLWFPTGGGKTEAYLALTAFEIVLRRLRYGEAGAGTAVIMRYTLRLLTSQQFERCATLVSVLETMRRTQLDLHLGDARISLGLWVGGDTTPNRLSNDDEKNPGAVQLAERVRSVVRPENPFQLLTCPHCGTRIVPERRAPDSHYGIDVSASAFRLFCPDSRCILHPGIPVSVIDEDLYNRPPSLLIGTIDKFARMVWEPNSKAFFGIGTTDTIAPGLIIQDELHLITGPLGTIAGIYEAAVDTILQSRGVVPKYIAATATIQRASEQCRSLYARSAFLFPPPGLDASDSYFSREDQNDPGRLYLGVMGPGLYSALTALIQVSAAAADCVQAIPERAVAEDGKRLRDTYWTQVIYHNSRQELGKTTTMLRDDVRTRLEILEPNSSFRRHFNDVEELSANLKGPEVSAALEKLEVEWPEPSVIDALACTNMISVGIDVGRLGMMIVKGQPKSTAEYIQATSRVGRSKTRPPGIVVALYTSFRPRDRSHYETFQSFHQALYRGVEPSSVTPFAPPALDRTLHACLVMVVRHCLRWDRPEDAARFDAASASDILVVLRSRLSEAAQTDEMLPVLQMLDDLAAEWVAAASETGGGPFVFSGSKQYRSLLRRFEQHDSKFGMWPTLNSMRHVDGETRFEVWGAGE
jgi:hypothetical protein